MIVTSVLIRAPIGAVWGAVSDLASHGEWMADAESIEFATETTAGVGARLNVATRIGPLRTLDVLEVTAWEERRLIEVRHQGLVSGRGSFELTPMAGGTRFMWRESISFPWWLGGPLTAWLARPVLSRIWGSNLQRLKRLVESRYSATA